MRPILLLLLFLSPLKIFASEPSTLESDAMYDLQPVVWRITVDGHAHYMIGTNHTVSYAGCSRATQAAIDEAFAGFPQIMLSEAGGDFSGRIITENHIKYLMGFPGVILQPNNEDFKNPYADRWPPDVSDGDLNTCNDLLRQGWLTRRMARNRDEFEPKLSMLLSQGYTIEFFDSLHPLIFRGMMDLFGGTPPLDISLTTRFQEAFPAAPLVALDSSPEKVMTALIESVGRWIQRLSFQDIVSTFEKDIGGKPRFSITAEDKALFSERNQTWWPRIKDALDNHESVLVVVGRGHLDYGQGTLLDFLRDDSPKAVVEKIG